MKNNLINEIGRINFLMGNLLTENIVSPAIRWISKILSKSSSIDDVLNKLFKRGISDVEEREVRDILERSRGTSGKIGENLKNLTTREIAKIFTHLEPKEVAKIMIQSGIGFNTNVINKVIDDMIEKIKLDVNNYDLMLKNFSENKKTFFGKLDTDITDEDILKIVDEYFILFNKKLDDTIKSKDPSLFQKIKTNRIITSVDYKTQINQILRQEVENTFDELIKLGENIEKKTKDSTTPFKIPKSLKGKNSNTLKLEIEKQIRETVNTAMGTDRTLSLSLNKIEKFKNILNDLTDKEKERIIKNAIDEATRLMGKGFVDIIDSLEKKIGLPIERVNKLKESVSKLINTFKRYNFDFVYNKLGASSFLKKIAIQITSLILLEVINWFIIYKVRKNYDKSTDLPTLGFNGNPLGGSLSDVTSWAFGLIFRTPTILYNIIANVWNGFANTGNKETYLKELESSVERLKTNNQIPKTNFGNADISTKEAFIKFINKFLPSGVQISPDGDINTLLDKIKSLDLNFNDEVIDRLVGLPTQQFYISGENVYFVNKNGRFYVNGFDTDKPYIEGRVGSEDSEEDKRVYIKDLFEDKENRFLIDLYPIDVQDKLPKKLVDIIIDRVGSDVYNSELSKSFRQAADDIGYSKKQYEQMYVLKSDPPIKAMYNDAEMRGPKDEHYYVDNGTDPTLTTGWSKIPKN